LITAAVAIRLLVHPSSTLPSFSVPIVAAILAMSAFALAPKRYTRIAALLIVLGAITDTATIFITGQSHTSFEERSTRALERYSNRLRTNMITEEGRLTRVADEIARQLQVRPNSSRQDLFRLAHRYVSKSTEGVCISDQKGPVAWWGEDLPMRTAGRFLFDSTNLYIVISREVTAGGTPVRIDVLERWPNRQDRSSRLLTPISAWVTEVRFHAGVLKLSPAARRFLLLRDSGRAIYADLTPTSQEEVLRLMRERGGTASSLLLAAALLLMAAFELRRWRHSTQPVWSSLFLTAAFMLLAREALLWMKISSFPSIFGFDVYASRILGDFTSSPVALFFTAVLFALTSYIVVEVLSNQVPSLAFFAPLLTPCASLFLLLFISNLVQNSRLSAIPDHILPGTPAQALLMTSLLLLAYAVVNLTAIRNPFRSRLVVAGGIVLLSIPIALSRTGIERRGFLSLVAACALLELANAPRYTVITRRLLYAVGIVVALYPALALFEQESRERFVAETYAPLVLGESGQLRSMIQDALDSELSRVELTEVLPDDPSRMDLNDLAYALWLRSDLSVWRIPAVITVSDDRGVQLSRFGVGLPQFPERQTEVGSEMLQMGGMTKELLHFNFDVTRNGSPAGSGSVHIVNPTEPGSSSFIDVYRDLFSRNPEESSSALHFPQEPVIFERDGSVRGQPAFHLPQNPPWYFRAIKPGQGLWERSAQDQDQRIYLRATSKALYAFPLTIPSRAQHLRRAGGLAVWTLLVVLITAALRLLPGLIDFARAFPRNVGFRARTAAYITAVVIFPLLIFVVFVRAYLSARLEIEYLERGQAALNTAERVIEDYLASSSAQRPEQILDDTILTWLARVVGHDLHLYRDDYVFASSRRDLFTAHIESPHLPGDVYSAIVLRGSQLIRAQRQSGSTRFVELYVPISLSTSGHYTLALPFIVQGRQIETQANDVATSIYLILILISFAAVVVAYRAARSVTTPVHALVQSARAVAAGRFDIAMAPPDDPDLRLLVNTFGDMALSIQRQQDDLRHERDRLQTLLENITAAVVVLDRQRHIVAANLAARDLFEITFLPADNRSVFKPQFPDINDFLAHYHSREAASEEISIQVDQGVRTYRVSIVPLPEGDEEMLIAEDVTEILRSNRLEAWAEMARQIAHEIKNPLTPIQLTAEHLRALADDGDPNLPNVVRTGVENILRQVTTLKETSREFSDYASAREALRRPIDLQQLLLEIANDYQNSSERGVEVQAEISDATPTRFLADRRLLRGAITNLLENALQATPAGGEVVLRSGMRNGRVFISVQDTGPGVADDLLPRIFDPYFSTKSSGTGLGLAIARKTIEDHGGAIRGSNSSTGFTITIELPVVTETAEAGIEGSIVNRG
ncbi:MAG TPA: ATP-binding protein, partial [Thermoanaerobaculia bacterium]|nr:ATP-binding protein [Thermoanaerobaculia bacterium]